MRALSLPGCGCRAAFQLAVLQRLARRGERFDLVAGASSGSISGSVWVSGLADDGPDVLRSMGSTPVFSAKWLRSERSPFGMSAIVKDVLKRFLPEEGITGSATELLVATARAERLVRAILTHVRSRTGVPAATWPFAPPSLVRHAVTVGDALVVHSSRERRDMHDIILASCTIPGVYAKLPVIDGEVHVDGGAADNTLLESLFARGATEVTVVTPYVGGVVSPTLFERERPPRVPPDVRLRVFSPLRPLRLGRFDFDGERLEEALAMKHVEDELAPGGAWAASSTGTHG